MTPSLNTAINIGRDYLRGYIGGRGCVDSAVYVSEMRVTGLYAMPELTPVEIRELRAELVEYNASLRRAYARARAYRRGPYARAGR